MRTYSTALLVALWGCASSSAGSDGSVESGEDALTRSCVPSAEQALWIATQLGSCLDQGTVEQWLAALYDPVAAPASDRGALGCDAVACLEASRGCDEVRACGVRASAPPAGSTCEPRCDGTTLVACEGGAPTALDCGAVVAGASCREVSGDRPLHAICGVAAACDPAGDGLAPRCDGTTLVACGGGALGRVDCVAAGFTACEAGACRP